MTSCFSKVIVIEMYGECLLTSELQFGFKPGLSPTMCTGVLKAVVSQYLDGGPGFMVFLLMLRRLLTQYFDHTILLGKLLSGGLPNAMVHFVLGWYQSQHLRTNGMVSPRMLSVSHGMFIRVASFHLFCLLFT